MLKICSNTDFQRKQPFFLHCKSKPPRHMARECRHIFVLQNYQSKTLQHCMLPLSFVLRLLMLQNYFGATGSTESHWIICKTKSHWIWIMFKHQSHTPSGNRSPSGDRCSDPVPLVLYSCVCMTLNYTCIQRLNVPTKEWILLWMVQLSLYHSLWRVTLLNSRRICGWEIRKHRYWFLSRGFF